MQIKSYYDDTIMRHNLQPTHKRELPAANLKLDGVNLSCGDHITLYLIINDKGIIENGTFTGDGCAISQASTDMMLDLLIGKERGDALRLCNLFLKTIKGEIGESDLRELGEATVMKSITQKPSRIRCAVLGWKTMERILAGRSG